MVLGLGMVCSAHATHIECGDTFGDTFDNQTIVLDDDLTCSTDDNEDYAIRITGSNIHFLLNDNSITAVDEPPASGIFITDEDDGGNGNHVTGPGTVEGFNSNIFIENADNNHVSRLHLNEGGNGVNLLIRDGEQAKGNYICHNIIKNPELDGIMITLLGNSGIAQPKSTTTFLRRPSFTL